MAGSEYYDDDNYSTSYMYGEKIEKGFKFKLNDVGENCPQHYNHTIQPWDYMQSIMSGEQFEGYLAGNVIKYISRYKDKNGVQDLAKAEHYLQKLIEFKS